MKKERLNKFKTQTGSLQSMERRKGSMGVIQRNCPNRQGDEIIAVVIISMRGTERGVKPKRNK